MSNPLTDIAKGVKRAHYAAGQAARVLWFTGHYAYGRRVMGPLTEPGEAPYAEEFGPLDRDRLKSSFRELFQSDWKNIADGVYKMPRELRKAPSPARLLRQSRDYFRDAANVARRKAGRQHSEVLTEKAKEKYPRYYLQNFHFQTDGWLSPESAERYDMQVETLFTGAAGAMRRQALPALRRALEGRDAGAARMLDLGCGAGGFLADVKDNWPQLHITALDLSPAYLDRARAALSAWRGIEFLTGDAEATGLPDASQEIVTAVYLFHELPPKVRASVAREIARVLKPGGVFILVDTIQYGDEPGFDILLENFPRGFHEPYYDSFCRLDLQEEFAKEGLDLCESNCAFLTKVSEFHNPS